MNNKIFLYLFSLFLFGLIIVSALGRLELPGPNIRSQGTTIPTSSSSYRYTSWTCYDGSSERQGDETSCKPFEVWYNYAKESCFARCLGRRCSVISFSVNAQCSDNTCGNNICEVGEADTGCKPCTTNPCLAVPCKQGTCPKDCNSTRIPTFTISCFASPTSANIGQDITWTASASGGTGSYTYSWSGADSLTGTSKSIQKSYGISGTKTGSVAITSGTQTKTQACSNSVTVTMASVISPPPPPGPIPTPPVPPPPPPMSAIGPQYIVISPQENEEFLQPGVLQDMINKLGRGTATRRLGWMLRIQSFQVTDATVIRATLQKAFTLAEQYDLPLAFHIDAEFRWENRPDLWNWWDPTMAGYNPDNKFNVEWSDWDTPTKERWINWGSPLALKPQPCFGSPRVRQELLARAAVIGDAVEAWRQHLISIGKPELFIGVNPTGETGLEDLRTFGAQIGIPSQGRIQSGFCSLYQRGYRKTSPPSDMARALALEVQDYANAEVSAYKVRGIPAAYLSTHAPTGVYGKQYANAPAWTALNANSIPGFSVYEPNEISDIKAGIGNRDWIISESQWSMLATYINAPRLHWMALYNWCTTCAAGSGMIANDPNAHSAIKTALGFSSSGATNNASFISQSVPTSVTPGQNFSVSITMKNTGDTTWDGQYLLGDPSGGAVWGSIRIPLSVTSVASGSTHTFSTTLRAPSTPGSYSFQWQVVKEGVEWFGDKTPAKSFLVSSLGTTNNASFISQSVPTSVTSGQNFSVSITIKNTGDTTWNGQYLLGDQSGGAVWGSIRIPLSVASVAPGSTHIFNGILKAPSTPGSYSFQWQMVKEGVAWFGPKTTQLTITVGSVVSTCFSWPASGVSLQTAVSANNCVEIQAGTHVLTSRVVIPDGHTVRGVGRDKSILKADASVWQFGCCDALLTGTLNPNAKPAIIENIGFDGSSIATYAVLTGDNMVIRNTFMTKTRCSGVGINSLNAVVDSNIIEHSADITLIPGRGVIGCASGGGGVVEGAGVYIRGEKGDTKRAFAPVITNNIIRNNFGPALDCAGGWGGTFSNNQVYGNSAWAAVSLYGCSNWTIQNNQISHPAGEPPQPHHPSCVGGPAGGHSAGIFVCQDSRSFDAVGNQIIGNHASSFYGILLVGADEISPTMLPRRNIIKNNNVIGSNVGCADDLKTNQLPSNELNIWEGNNCQGTPNSGPTYY